MVRWALLVVLFSGAAWADLEPESAAWDGLSEWAELLRARGELVLRPVDLADLPPDAGVALVGPVELADPALVRQFVHGGGRVLIAAEGPKADALLAQFELRTAPAPTEDALVRLTRENGRFAGRQPLVANHPRALLGPARLDPIIRHADGAPFAFHVRAGAGEALIVADTSVFINLMQRAPGNQAFGRQVAAWLAARGTVALVAGPDAALTGQGGGRPQRSLTDALDEALHGLGGAANGPGERAAVDFFLALFLAAAVAYLLRVFPGGKGPPEPPLSALGAAGDVERRAGAPGGPAAPEVDG